LFNELRVELVVHTGDITNSKSLKRFSNLACKLVCVYGNNDREEEGLSELANCLGFNIYSPPHILELHQKRIAIFHEPDSVEDFLKATKNIDIVLHGHTHRYREEHIESTIIFNPGESAGILKGKNAVGLIDLDNSKIKRIFF